MAYLFASMGVPTGLDFERLIALRAQVAAWLDGEPLHGAIWRAGLPKTMGPHEHTARTTAAAEGPSKVVEFTHMVMGPTCGMVLADLGAEVIKVEPIDGDRTRTLLGAGTGFFPMFNRNKKSIQIDLHKPAGAAVARQLARAPTWWPRTSSPARWSSTGSTTRRCRRQPSA